MGIRAIFWRESMAARSIASLTVSFGLVSIPVRLFSATEATKAISFNLLHKGCGSRLKQQYFCIKEEVRDRSVGGTRQAIHRDDPRAGVPVQWGKRHSWARHAAAHVRG